MQGSDPSRSSRDSKLHVPNCKGLTPALDGDALGENENWLNLFSGRIGCLSRTGFDGDRVSWVTRSLRRA